MTVQPRPFGHTSRLQHKKPSWEPSGQHRLEPWPHISWERRPLPKWVQTFHSQGFTLPREERNQPDEHPFPLRLSSEAACGDVFQDLKVLETSSYV